MSERLIGVPKSWVQPIQEVVALYNEYGSVPRAIAAIISLYIVNAFLNLAGYLVGSIVMVGDIAAGSLDAVRGILGGIGQVIGFNFLTVASEIQLAIADVVTQLGPLGPPVAIGTGAILLYLAYLLIVRIGIAVVGELPVGSSIVDILGLR